MIDAANDALEKMSEHVDRAAQSERGEELATIKLYAAVGLVKHSNLPADQLADFLHCAIKLHRQQVIVDNLTSLYEAIKNLTSADEIKAIIAMGILIGVKQASADQDRLATMAAIFDDEPHLKKTGQEQPAAT